MMTLGGPLNRQGTLQPCKTYIKRVCNAIIIGFAVTEGGSLGGWELDSPSHVVKSG